MTHAAVAKSAPNSSERTIITEAIKVWADPDAGPYERDGEYHKLLDLGTQAAWRLLIGRFSKCPGDMGVGVAKKFFENLPQNEEARGCGKYVIAMAHQAAVKARKENKNAITPQLVVCIGLQAINPAMLPQALKRFQRSDGSLHASLRPFREPRIHAAPANPEPSRQERAASSDAAAVNPGVFAENLAEVVHQ